VAAVVVVAAGIGTTLFAVQASGPATRSSRPPELMLDQLTPPPSAALARLEGQAWAAVGGLDHLNAFMSAERGYTAVLKAAGNSTSDSGFTTAMSKLSTRCDTLARVTKGAREYFTVPEPTGQQMWSNLLTRHWQLVTACRDLATRPGTGTAEAATTARQNAVDSTDAMIYWLAETGAIRRKPA
jgi:hypothetical protein